MPEITTPSGKIAAIHAAPFGDAMRLNNAALDAFADKGVADADIKKVLNNLNRLSEADIDIGAFLKGFIGVCASEKVLAALWPCLGRCTYNKSRITPDTFEDVSARGDFYAVAAACFKENILPLWQPLLSSFGGTEKIVESVTQK